MWNFIYLHNRFKIDAARATGKGRIILLSIFYVVPVVFPSEMTLKTLDNSLRPVCLSLLYFSGSF
jgi:hypothetical protein